MRFNVHHVKLTARLVEHRQHIDTAYPNAALPVMMNRTNFGRPPDTGLDKYYEENVIGGPGSFMIAAASFDDFGRAVRSKLIREISSVPRSRATPV